MTLAIAHREQHGSVVLDCVIEKRAPSPPTKLSASSPAR